MSSLLTISLINLQEAKKIEFASFDGLCLVKAWVYWFICSPMSTFPCLDSYQDGDSQPATDDEEPV